MHLLIQIIIALIILSIMIVGIGFITNKKPDEVVPEFIQEFKKI